jgi:hypothetical protein
MTRFSESTIVHEVFIELWLLDVAIIVLIDEFEDRDSMLVGVRLQNVCEVRSFGLWRNTEAARVVA